MHTQAFADMACTKMRYYYLQNLLVSLAGLASTGGAVAATAGLAAAAVRNEIASVLAEQRCICP